MGLHLNLSFSFSKKVNSHVTTGVKHRYMWSVGIADRCSRSIRYIEEGKIAKNSKMEGLGLQGRITIVI